MAGGPCLTLTGARSGKTLRIQVPQSWPRETTVRRVVRTFAKRCEVEAEELVLVREDGWRVPDGTCVFAADLGSQFVVRRRVRALVVTLERDPLRQRHVRENVLPALGDGASVFSAVDGRRGDELRAALSEFGVGLDAAYARTCTVGQLGCACSHLKAWRLVAGHVGGRLVLEDDVVLVDGFLDELDRLLDEAGDNFDLLYLFHHLDCRPPDVTSRRGLVPGFPTWGTVAYVVTPRGANTLLKHLTHTTHDRPIDEMIMDLVRRQLLQTFVALPSLASTAGTLNPLHKGARLGSNVWGSPRLVEDDSQQDDQERSCTHMSAADPADASRR